MEKQMTEKLEKKFKKMGTENLRKKWNSLKKGDEKNVALRVLEDRLKKDVIGKTVEFPIYRSTETGTGIVQSTHHYKRDNNRYVIIKTPDGKTTFKRITSIKFV